MPRSMTRRHFLQQGAAAAVALSTTPSLLADPLGLPIGCQTYPVRASINPDFAGTMKGLSAAGFQTIELCSPFGYKEFSSLAKYKPQELRRMLNDYGSPVSARTSIRTSCSTMRKSGSRGPRSLA